MSEHHSTYERSTQAFETSRATHTAKSRTLEQIHNKMSINILPGRAEVYSMFCLLRIHNLLINNMPLQSKEGFFFNQVNFHNMFLKWCMFTT